MSAMPPRTMADFVERLGNIPLHRIRFQPLPGTATLADVHHQDPCELIDGTLVEKSMGAPESSLALYLGHLLYGFVLQKNLGILTGEQGLIQLGRGLVRIPDVAFISWDRLPGRVRPRTHIYNVIPDLAIEVLSLSNTPAEMTRKRTEYFTAGVTVVWEVDEPQRQIIVYRSETDMQILTSQHTLYGDPVLPGFQLPLQELFGEMDRHG